MIYLLRNPQYLFVIFKSRDILMADSGPNNFRLPFVNLSLLHISHARREAN